MKSNTSAREEEGRRFSFRYVGSVKSPDEHVLSSNREIRRAFRAHFRDCFAAVLTSQFRSFAVFPAFGGQKRLVARVWLLNAKSVMR